MNIFSIFREDLFSRITKFVIFREDLISRIAHFQIFRVDLISRIKAEKKKQKRGKYYIYHRLLSQEWIDRRNWTHNECDMLTKIIW